VSYEIKKKDFIECLLDDLDFIQRRVEERTHVDINRDGHIAHVPADHHPHPLQRKD